MRRLLLLPFALTTTLACTKPAPSASLDAGGAPLASAAPSAVAAPKKSAAIVREEVTVVVAGITEHWRLEWRKPPTPECMDDAWYTCPCNGLEFGEEGELDLVRARDGSPEERLALDALYMNNTAALPRWQKLPADSAKLAEPPSPETLRGRPLVPIMKIADYDHDGQASEFVLQVGYEACGHSPTLVIGVDAKNPKLHAFASVETPKEPILLETPAQWEQVRKTLPAILPKISCGDHGSDVDQTTRITRDAAGLHVATTEKPCR
jgi:hypothetical protein